MKRFYARGIWNVQKNCRTFASQVRLCVLIGARKTFLADYLILVVAAASRGFRLPRGITVDQYVARDVTRECDEREHGEHLPHSYRAIRNLNALSSRHRDSLPPTGHFAISSLLLRATKCT